jgi:hypothetical protein
LSTKIYHVVGGTGLPPVVLIVSAAGGRLAHVAS